MVPMLVQLAERARGFAGDAGDAFLDREPEQGRRHVHGQQKRGDRRGAGIAVGGNGNMAPCAGARPRPAAAASRAAHRRRRAAAPPRCRTAPSRRRRSRRYIRDDRRKARRSAAASAAPCRLESWSACSLTGRPFAFAASNTRAICSGEKAMPSQKASTASARPACLICGIMAQTLAMKASLSLRFRRQRMRAEKAS